MRFVNEIHYSTQVSVGGRGPYAKAVGEEKATGFPVEILISVCHPHGSPLPEDGAIEIEGDAACILGALEAVCLQLRGLGEVNAAEHDLDPAWKDKAKRLQEEWQAEAKRMRENFMRGPLSAAEEPER